VGVNFDLKGDDDRKGDADCKGDDEVNADERNGEFQLL